MASKAQIPTSRNADLVTFTIKIDGTAIPQTIGVMSILVQKEVNRIPVAKIVMLDGDPATQDFEVSNEDLFIPGKEIEILGGYHSDEETIFKGIIIKHSLKIRQNGTGTLMIECKDHAVKMTVGRKSKYFYESKDSEVIESIISEYGLSAEVDATNTTHPELVQYRTSDWDFIQTRAEVNGKISLVENGTVKIVDPDFSQSPVLSLSYGDTILTFNAEIDARNQYKTVVSKAWNYQDQAVVEVEATDPSTTDNGNLSPADLSNTIGLDQYEIQHGGKADESELKAWADAQMLRNRMAKIQGNVSFQGFPNVIPGSIIELSGVGDRFNGNAFVSAVRHQIVDGNWVTDAQFGFNPEWFTETFETSQTQASGLYPAINGLQIGIVTQLQEDPDGDHRILVHLPMIKANEKGVWARIASLDAGENRGAFFRPEIGDEVILGFINDDPGEAVVLGMLNSSAKPAPLTESDDNHEKGFVTRSEMKLLFNDDKKSILIETPGGNKISLSEDEGAITIEDENSNKILMDSSGITIESASNLNIKATGDVNIEGTNINAKAKAQFKAEGSAGAEMSTSGMAVLKGSMVQIN